MKSTPANALELGTSTRSKRKLLFASALALLAFLLASLTSYRAMVAAGESEREARQSHQLLDRLQSSLSAVMNAESSFRGFILTGASHELDSYRTSTRAVAQGQAALRHVSLAKPELKRALPDLEALLARKLEFAENVVVLRQAQGLDAAAAAIAGGHGSRIMTGFHDEILALRDHELEGLALRDARALQLAGRAKTTLLLATLLGSLLALAVGWFAWRRHFEDARARSQREDNFRMLLDGVQDHAIFMLDTGGLVSSWNAGAQRIKGYAAEEILGRHFSCFFTAEDIQRGWPAELLRRTVASDHHDEECVRVRKDGSQFLAHVSLTTLRDSSGTLRGFSEISRDLTLAQEAGTRSRGLLEAAPDAMVVVNQTGAIVLLNLQAETQFRYRRDELVGQQVTTIIPHGFAERLVADGTRTAAEALAQQIGTGIELSGRRSDGTEFPLELMLSPLESADGVLVTAAIRDISVRKAAEARLAQMEGRYRGLLEAAPDAMVVVNQAGDIVLLNVQAEKQFGYRRDELLGQKVTNIIPHGFAERLVADALRSPEDALAQQIGTGIELTGLHKSGGRFPIEIMLSPLKSSEGVLVTAAIRDITTRKKAEAHLLAEEQLHHNMEQLKRSNEELGQFAYIASHDLQEPLRMVASYTQLLSKRYKGRLDADADEFIAFAVDGAERMQRLIQDLLIYSRVGTESAPPTETSSEAALDQALDNLGAAIEDSGAEVTHDPLPAVVADEGQLVQLFQNLVGNGVKYHGTAAPRVHVSAADNGAGQWLFSVRDNGLGIDSQYFEKIFGMFQRLHQRQEFAGTGIGLAICKKIVEQHGGQLTVESKLGSGSTFRFGMAGAQERS